MLKLYRVDYQAKWEGGSYLVVAESPAEALAKAQERHRQSFLSEDGWDWDDSEVVEGVVLAPECKQGVVVCFHYCE